MTKASEQAARSLEEMAERVRRDDIAAVVAVIVPAQRNERDRVACHVRMIGSGPAIALGMDALDQQFNSTIAPPEGSA